SVSGAGGGESKRVGRAQPGMGAEAGWARGGWRDRVEALPPRPGRRAESRAHKDAAAERLRTFEPQASLAGAIRSALPDDAITVNDLTQVTFFRTGGFSLYEPRAFHAPGYPGTIRPPHPTPPRAPASRPH